MKTRALTTRAAWSVAALAASLTAAHAFDLPKIGNPFGGGAAAPATPGATLDCPAVSMEPGAAMVRVPANADSAGVRYQLSIAGASRECVIAGDRLTITVEVDGAAMLGPLGQPGAYGGNLRILVRALKDDSIVSTKVYRAGVTIPAGASRADFRVSGEPVAASVLSPRAQDDYEIVVGFTQGGADAVEKPEKKRRRKR